MKTRRTRAPPTAAPLRDTFVDNGASSSGRPNSGFSDVFGDAALESFNFDQRTGSSFCPKCDEFGDDAATIFAACFAGDYVECAADELCGIEIRQRGGAVRGIRTACMPTHQCITATRQNFYSTDAQDARFTQCRPENSLQSLRYGESTCRGCTNICTSANDLNENCLGRMDDDSKYILDGATSTTFETALALDSNGVNVRSYWDNISNGLIENI